MDTETLQVEAETSRPAAYTERSNALRLELKAWEKDFAAANEGRKAGRDDIKKNPDVGKKVHEYASNSH